MDIDGIREMGLIDRFFKRSFDLVLAIIGLIIFSWLILLSWIIASMETRSNGFFIQARVGRKGKNFPVIKIKTMYKNTGGSVTIANDVRITKSGTFFRAWKIDELPQLINVFLGQMSFVGPRPDVPGYADQLVGDDLVILSMRPGITGPATLKYRDEERLLAEQADPDVYNREVIYPDKVEINKQYLENYSMLLDLRYIWQTVFGAF